MLLDAGFNINVSNAVNSIYDTFDITLDSVADLNELSLLLGEALELDAAYNSITICDD